MKRVLRDLLYNLKYVDILGSTDLVISQPCINSVNVSIMQR